MAAGRFWHESFARQWQQPRAGNDHAGAGGNDRRIRGRGRGDGGHTARRQALGGLLADPDEGVSISWTPDPNTQINMDRGAFLLLHIPNTGGGAEMLSYQRTADSIVFEVTGQGGLYAVYYKDAEPVKMTASVVSESSSYYIGDELRIEVNVTSSDEESSAGSPTGKISVYLGDPANEGILLMSYELQQSDNGKAVISYVVQKELA